MVARINTIAFSGVDVQSIDVQVQISNGLPAFTIVGYILLFLTLFFSYPAKAQNSQTVLDKELSQIYQKRDLKKMEEFASAGNIKAQTWLGLMFQHEANYVEAMKWYSLAGNKGDSWAISQAAFLHKMGLGTAKSATEEAKWYKKGAELGISTHQMNYAYALLEGDGLEKNENEAFRWFSKAANQNNIDAYYALADLCSKGVGTEYDPVKAYAYVRYFLEHGFIDSLDNRDTESYEIKNNMKKQLSKDQKIASDKLLDELNKNGR